MLSVYGRYCRVGYGLRASSLALHEVMPGGIRTPSERESLDRLLLLGP